MPNDCELVQQLLRLCGVEGHGKHGWDDPFECLRKRHDGFLRAVLSGQIWTPREDLDDLVQEVWLKLWRNDCRGLRQWRGLDGGDPSASLRPYLRTIAKSVLLDHPPHPIGEQAVEDDAEAVQPQEPPSVEPGDAERILQVCDEVCPNRNCRIVRLYYLDEATVLDIAERFGLAERGVRTVLHRCRRAIQKKLGLN